MHKLAWQISQPVSHNLRVTTCESQTLQSLESKPNMHDSEFVRRACERRQMKSK